ncbi:MAG: hypothetical protein WC661_16010 [Opitutaceae bacterium]|jgi:hypothetical protein
MSSPHPIPPPVIGCRPRRFARSGGFALLITVTLLAFLVLLLVSLASLTRVETQVAANATRLAQARANALFALNLAIGQLQKYAGPDQAVTARADIDAAVQTLLDGGKSCNPFWTGVWDARPPSSVTPTHAAAPASSAPMAWLVSGNETNGTAITPVTAAVADPEADPNNVWLVRKVLGEELKSTATYPQDGRVKLAKSAIKVPASQIPGAAASGPDVQVGAYAWWVGDEGIKAKVNLGDPYRTAASTDDEAAWRREAAPRPDMELLAGSAYQTAFANVTAAFETRRGMVLSTEQLPMLHADLATATGVTQTGRYFHELTTVGSGVLADTLRGGLRRDLTRGLAASPPTGTTVADEMGDSTPVLSLPATGPVGRTAPTQTYTANKEPVAPIWAQVRSFWAQRADASDTIAPVEAPLANPGVTAPSAQALLPIPVMVRLGYGMDATAGPNYRFVFTPVVVLCNPYNVALAPSTYRIKYQSVAGDGYQAKYTLSGGGVSGTLYFPASTSAKTILFDIAADGFAPGEVRVYTSTATTAFDPLANNPIALSAGYRTAYVYQDSSTAVPSPLPAAARVELTSIAGSQHPTVSLGIGATPSEIIRWIEMEPTLDKLGKTERPSAVLSDPTTHELYAVGFHLRDATWSRNTSGNQSGTQNHQVPSGHPARRSDGGTVGDYSGTRMLIDSNPRAVVSQRLGGWDCVASWGFEALNSYSPHHDDLTFAYDGDNGFWGGGIDGDAYSATHVILFDVLRQNEEVVSLARLGQVNWGVDGKHPAYPLGNSYASIFYKHDTPDYGYALNEALWDRFFLSTLPASLATRPANLPNARLRFHDPDGVAALTSLEGAPGYELAATRLMIDGAFNINSTSVEAWTAFLGSVQASDYAYQSRAGTRTDSNVRPFPRVIGLHDADPTDETGKLYEWTGYRSLSATQLRQLATEIVAGIKARGRPARSLAEFINRDLSLPATDPRNQTGIVQAAIDAVVNPDKETDPGAGVAGLEDLPGLDPALVVKSSLINADNPDAATGRLRTTGVPGFLLQGDLLAPLAPAMSARSDTFRVRTYGEVVNPATGAIEGRAWCEAIMQREPGFVDQADANLADPSKPTTALGNATAPANTNATNQAFGRKFVIVQFRWLGPDEI